jgi:UPF0176 protein
MKKLYNTIDKRVLKERAKQEQEARTTVSFYKYHPIEDPQSFRDTLFEEWESLRVCGRTYIANEGVNAQISVPTDLFDAFKTSLYAIPFLDGVRLNTAVEEAGNSFFKLSIKIRKKIVADGIDDPTFNPSNTGNHLSAEAFNAITDDPNTILIDMRNHYESEVGHFENAILPDADSFREEIALLPDMLKGKEDHNIVMYCTGGIRCEKASAYMLHQGFKNVFHLEGGIINYAHQAEEAGIEKKFIGKNFVFDNRLGERITEDIISVCHQCGNPADTHTNCLNNGCHLLFIQCETCAANYEGCCSKGCQDTIHMPLERQKELRKGVRLGQHIFNKSKRLRPRLNEPED